MKRSNYYRLKEGINRCSKFKGGKFQYALAKNMKKLEVEIELIEAAFKPSEDFLEFDKQKVALLTEYGKKDEHGQLLVHQANGEVIFESSEQKDKFQKAFEKLKTKFKKTIDETDKQNREKIAFLNEESDTIEWYMIKKEDIPEDATGDLMLIEDFLL
ncbi:MAG: hypothetical protein ABJQ37_01625 [Reichenbachiella sp.]|uniref:hypothetical protein n=1 Tax=Reichenbachiella sp. TaxID=2184521 RepID=UPI003298F8FB